MNSETGGQNKTALNTSGQLSKQAARYRALDSAYREQLTQKDMKNA